MSFHYTNSSEDYRDTIVSALRKNAHDFNPALTEEWIQKQANIASDLQLAFIALDGEQFVGYLSFKTFEKGDIMRSVYHNWERFQGYVYISNLFILPTYRHKGLGERLRMYGLEKVQMKSFKGVVTTCWAKNKAMIRMNENMDFMLVDTVPTPWRGTGEETLIYEKRFTN